MKLWPSSPRRASLPVLLVALSLALPLLAASVLAPQSAQAQAAQRTVQGKVSDKSDAPLKNAIVYLKDTRTLTVKSSITQEDGAYRFGQLSANTDYELWAELNGRKSAVKTISSFDSKSSFIFNLKIDTSK
ncbi:MAG: carboxypeptidase regulatory-like domain-containing protein [Acidobacteriota bacterium]|nr:carboxypeptidase regulatory-like domain-containing protein [Acidobacteriota bacterium]